MILNKQHVIIVGGGSFGISAALELHQRGRLVDVFDPGQIPHPMAAATGVSKVLRIDYSGDEASPFFGEC